MKAQHLEHLHMFPGSNGRQRQEALLRYLAPHMPDVTFSLRIQPAQQGCWQREALVDGLDLGNGIVAFAGRSQVDAAAAVDGVVAILAENPQHSRRVVVVRNQVNQYFTRAPDAPLEVVEQVVRPLGREEV